MKALIILILPIVICLCSEPSFAHRMQIDKNTQKIKPTPTTPAEPKIDPTFQERPYA